MVCPTATHHKRCDVAVQSLSTTVLLTKGWTTCGRRDSSFSPLVTQVVTGSFRYEGPLARFVCSVSMCSSNEHSFGGWSPEIDRKACSMREWGENNRLISGLTKLAMIWRQKAFFLGGNDVLLAWQHGVHGWSGPRTYEHGLAIALHNTSISSYSPTGQRRHLFHGSTFTCLLVPRNLMLMLRLELDA
jgi:hypothetical protein